MFIAPTTITSSTTAILTATSTPVNLLAVLEPRTSSSESTRTIAIAAKSGRAVSPANQVGRWSSDCRYADQPCATTAAPSMSSSRRSQPITQATTSPRVA